MTKHDEIRQMLHENGFKFKFEEGKTPLDMTDEEVEAFVVLFIKRMSELGRQMRVTMERLAVSVSQAVKPVTDVGRLLKEAEIREAESNNS